jgi:Na+-translocating ferredoxin:NAD+ oxidoreductase RNF subunit RnfB
MYMDENTGLPVVIEDKCTACNACVKACPKDIIELWPRGRKNKRIYVACINEDKGGIAKKYCSVACTGCEKCLDVCRYDSIVVENNLAVIDPEKCKLCKECVYVCKSDSIHMINFPPPKKDRPPVKDRPNRKLARRKSEVAEVEASSEQGIAASADKANPADAEAGIEKVADARPAEAEAGEEKVSDDKPGDALTGDQATRKGKSSDSENKVSKNEADGSAGDKNSGDVASENENKA